MENLESVLGDSFRAIYPKLDEYFDLEDKYFSIENIIKNTTLVLVSQAPG